MPVEATCTSGGYLCVSGGYLCQWRLPVPVKVPVPVEATCASGGYLCQVEAACAGGGHLCQWRCLCQWRLPVPVEATCACRIPVPVEAIPVPVEVPVLIQGRGVVHVNDGQEGVGDHPTPRGWRGYQGQTQVLNINQIKVYRLSRLELHESGAIG